MRALPILITADGALFEVLVGCGPTVLDFLAGGGQPAQRSTKLNWDEMLGLVAALTHPEIRSTPYGISKVRAVAAEEPPCVPRPAEPAEPMVTVRIPLAQASRLSEGMADLLCWLGGFRAALHDDQLDRLPMGIEQTRETRRFLCAAIAEVTGDEPEPPPF